MYNVYWMSQSFIDTVACNNRMFDTSELSLALKFCEKLRNTQGATHVTMSGEHPNSVGKQGVDVVGPDYEWKKRRI